MTLFAYTKPDKASFFFKYVTAHVFFVKYIKGCNLHSNVNVHRNVQKSYSPIQTDKFGKKIFDDARFGYFIFSSVSVRLVT